MHPVLRVEQEGANGGRRGSGFFFFSIFTEIARSSSAPPRQALEQRHPEPARGGLPRDHRRRELPRVSHQQRGGGARAVDRPAEAQRNQARYQSAMVDMGMGEDDEVEFARVQFHCREILGARVAAALEHAAVDQKA